MDVRTRPWSSDDIPRIVHYWRALSPADALRMGADTARFPSSEDYTRILKDQLETPSEQTTAFYSMWIVDGAAIGFSSLKNIRFGVRGEMHLHIWDEIQRGKGLGGRFFCLSALDFYDRFKVEEIVCEPSVSNAMPNRMLEKVGFPLIGSRVGRSSDLGFEQQLNTYAVTRDAALSHVFQSHLTGDLLELRPLRPEDWDELFLVASDRLIWEQHPAHDRYKEEVFREFFAEALESHTAFVVIDRKMQRVIGSSRYFGYEPVKREIEIGWTFLARSHWGGQYNGEMKRLMIDHAFQFVDSVVFLVGPDNLQSCKALEKIKAVLAGRRERASLHGKVVELVVYEIKK